MVNGRPKPHLSMDRDDDEEGVWQDQENQQNHQTTGTATTSQQQHDCSRLVQHTHQHTLTQARRYLSYCAQLVALRDPSGQFPDTLREMRSIQFKFHPGGKNCVVSVLFTQSLKYSIQQKVFFFYPLHSHFKDLITYLNAELLAYGPNSTMNTMNT